jgi:predicted site-specific integrase-resolvase
LLCEQSRQGYSDSGGTTGVIVLYGRLSGHNQQEDLRRQVQQLEHWALATLTGQKTLTLTDIGSGLNTTRKSLQKLLTMV